MYNKNKEDITSLPSVLVKYGKGVFEFGKKTPKCLLTQEPRDTRLKRRQKQLSPKNHNTVSDMQFEEQTVKLQKTPSLAILPLVTAGFLVAFIV